MRKDNQSVIDTFKSGDVIECNDGEKTVQFIVGDVNLMGGVCDDCSIKMDYDEIKVAGHAFTLDELKKLKEEFMDQWSEEDDLKFEFSRPGHFLGWLEFGDKWREK